MPHPSQSPQFQAALESLDAEWKAFQRTHKIIKRPDQIRQQSRFYSRQEMLELNERARSKDYTED